MHFDRADCFQFLALTAHTNPDISILELGSTTGLAASSILSSAAEGSDGVPQTFEYVFSSPNHDILKKAEQQLEPWKDRIKFKTLAIEKDPGSQGFDNGTFDVVIVSDPLGAVQDPEIILATTRKLLKPRGKLCLTTVTNPGMRLSMVLHCLPSWSR